MVRFDVIMNETTTKKCLNSIAPTVYFQLSWLLRIVVVLFDPTLMRVSGLSKLVVQRTSTLWEEELMC